MYKSKKVIMLEYIPLRILMEIISFSPYIFVVLFAKLIGALMYYLVPSTRKSRFNKLKTSFPRKNLQRKKKNSQTLYEIYDNNFCRIYKIFENVE